MAASCSIALRTEAHSHWPSASALLTTPLVTVYSSSPRGYPAAYTSIGGSMSPSYQVTAG